MNIGEKIKEIRQSKGMTRYKLHELSGVSYTQIFYYEKGTYNPTIQNAVKIASALEVSLEELLPTLSTV